jgi:hypothetical protein
MTLSLLLVLVELRWPRPIGQQLELGSTATDPCSVRLVSELFQGWCLG